MGQMTKTQKVSLGFVGTIVAAAVYIFGSIMGWWPNKLANDASAQGQANAAKQATAQYKAIEQEAAQYQAK